MRKWICQREQCKIAIIKEIPNRPRFIKTTVNDYCFSSFRVVNHRDFGWCIYVGWGRFLTSPELRGIAKKLDSYKTK